MSTSNLQAKMTLIKGGDMAKSKALWIGAAIGAICGCLGSVLFSAIVIAGMSNGPITSSDLYVYLFTLAGFSIIFGIPVMAFTGVLGLLAGIGFNMIRQFIDPQKSPPASPDQ